MMSYTPNQISKRKRKFYLITSALLLAYGGYGVWNNSIYLPSKHGSSTLLQGSSVWLMYGAMICACLAMLSVVVDHYDKRNNERHYAAFIKIIMIMGGWLFVAALVWDAWDHYNTWAVFR